MTDALSHEPHPAPAAQFLRRLIDGAFDRVSPLEPRRLSRFEPRALSVAGAVSDWREPWRGDEESSLQAAIAHEPEPPARSRMSSPDATVRSLAWPHEHENVVAWTAVDRSLEPDDRVSEAGTARSQVPVGIDTRREHSVRADRVLPAPALDPSIAGHLVQPIDVPHVRSAVTKLQASRERLQPAGNLTADRGEPATPVRGRSHRPVLDPASIAPSVRHDSRLTNPAAAPAPEPVINVTIGRIEVRVAPAAHAAARQRTDGAKPLGLDQYLRQRGGRR